MTIFIDMTGFGMVFPLLPFYADTFQAGSTALGILVASFSITQFIFSPILGRVSDSVGRRPVLLLSILTSTASFVLFALANSFLILLLSRAIAGMATETAVAQAYIADITSEKERATGIGRVAAAHGAGFIIGPAIGGFLSIYGFWAAGSVAALLTLLNFLFVFFFLPESVDHALLNMRIASKSNDGYLGRLLDALAKPIIGVVLVILFIITLAFSAIPVIAPLLGRDFLGIGPAEVSYFFVYIGFVLVFLQGFVIGRLAKKFGEETLMAFGALLMTLGIFFVPLVPNIANFLVSFTIVVFGLGMMNILSRALFQKKLGPMNKEACWARPSLSQVSHGFQVL